MGNKKTPLGFVFPAVLILATHTPAQLSAQTLQEAVAEAIRTNPTVLAAIEEQKSYEEQTKQAFAGYLPEVNLTAGRGEEWTDSTTTRGAGNGEVNLTRTEVGVTVSQMLFDGMDTKYQVEKAEANYKSNSAKRLNTQETLTMTVVTAYLDTLRETELLRLTEQNLRLHQEILNKVREMTAIGAGSEVDIKQSESRYALVAAEREAAHGLKLDAEARYFNVVGSYGDSLSRPIIKEKHLPNSLAEALATAMDNHPNLAMSQADLEAAIAEKKGSMSSFWPTLSLELAANNTNNTCGTESYTKSASAMLELSYNLFQGGSDISKKRESIQNVGKTTENMEETKRGIREAVETAWNQLHTSKRRIRHIEKQVAVAKQVAKSYHDQFIMGSRSLLEVLDSESELHNAKKALVTEQFFLMRGSMQLLSAMGVLHKTLSLEPDQVMWSLASKNDLLNANTMILNLLHDTGRLPPLETMIPRIVPFQELETTPFVVPIPAEDDLRHDDGAILPDLIEFIELTTNATEPPLPDLLDFLPKEAYRDHQETTPDLLDFLKAQFDENDGDRLPGILDYLQDEVKRVKEKQTPNKGDVPVPEVRRKEEYQTPDMLDFLPEEARLDETNPGYDHNAPKNPNLNQMPKSKIDNMRAKMARRSTPGSSAPERESA